MDFELLRSFIFIGLIINECILASKVYEWQNNWGSGLSTKEFAQIHELDKTITHYATDESASAKSSPAVSLYDLNTREDDFKKGIVAIRPLVAKGSQVCFISQVVKYWPGTEKAVTNRHGTIVNAPKSINYYKVMKVFPSNLDPLSIQSIADFCNVDSDHIFYMDPIENVKGYKQKLKIHGLFGRLVVGIPDKHIDTVFGN
ncbi:uncharacterized protein LOC132722087 isoform X1 [Ruditapes philippinarum]|uniref:uncharacterized protein LOC132722087 isoform X1 n=2 Tax=Ruditapes philippinarum TaxID=129788 RepID=UPI00295B23FF|nr:uncharacterized protein LOC132722087 isoform X1 [Ruditapes philippinarum]